MQNFSFLAGLEVTEKFVGGLVVGSKWLLYLTSTKLLLSDFELCLRLIGLKGLEGMFSKKIEEKYSENSLKKLVISVFVWFADPPTTIGKCIKLTWKNHYLSDRQ